jgi:hypothetical protein
MNMDNWKASVVLEKVYKDGARRPAFSYLHSKMTLFRMILLCHT